MDLDLPSVHHRSLHETGHVVARVRDDQWHLPTPCEGWDVRALVDHVVVGNWWVPPLVAGSTIDEAVAAQPDLLGPDDRLGGQPVEAFERSAEAADAAFVAAGALDAPCAVSYGPVPGAVYCGHRVLDVVVHGWDLAVATGQTSGIAPDLVDALWLILEPQLEGLQASGAFGQPVPVAADADPATRLLAALGRRAP